MFRPNNPRIDFDVLSERIRFELAISGRRETNPDVVERPKEPIASGEPGVPAPSLLRGFKELVKGIPIIGDLLSRAWRSGHRFARTVIPLLLQAKGGDPISWGSGRSAHKRLLFVGAWREDNGQLELIRSFDKLRRMSEQPVQLVLSGRTTSVEFFRQIQSEIQARGLNDQVITFENQTNNQLDHLFRSCDLYVSLSSRDTSSPLKESAPLARAMACDLPVIAYCPGIVPFLLGGAGLILETCEPDILASVCKVVLEEPWLHRQILHGQRTELKRFDRLCVRKYLRQSADKLRSAIHRKMSRPTTGGWRIEGPFDRSYSLAIVNREISLALAQQGEDVALNSRDGPGPFPPDMAMLEGNPAVNSMWRHGLVQRLPDVVLRNTYPPWVSDLKGELRGLVCYAWEEGGFPPEYVREFNTHLDLVTVTSRYVAKVLRDNGVRAPIRVVGDGVDQMTRLPASPARTAEISAQYGIDGKFCFLHISSCLPRKAIDTMLAAWAQAFRASDGVVLVIKAAQNEHHRVADDVAALRKADPQSAPVILIEQDIPAADIHAWYQRCDVFVAASRGEGFGLPMAEALALGKPVIVTGYGGQMDFCSAANAWLCDYDFAYARSHLSTPNSVWVEPRLESLVECLQQAHGASTEDRKRRGEIGRAAVRANFGWANVAARLRDGISDVRALDSRALQLPRIGWVSTWNSRCGIAAYSQSLTSGFPEGYLRVFANWNADRLSADREFVRRCWEQSWRDPLDDLHEQIRQAAVDAVVVQFNFGFYDLQAFTRLVERLTDAGIAVYVFLHSTADIERPDLIIRLADAAASLARARRVLVHSVHDLNRLKRVGLIDNVAILPFGLPQMPVTVPRPAPGARAKKLVATFGYLLAHKGLPELIEAVALLRQDQFDVDLLMLNALFPAAESEAMQRVCEEAIAQHGLTGHVRLRTDYLAEAEALAALAEADLIVYPYQQTQESASAAVRLGLASLVPVATTPLAIFDDVRAITHGLPGVTPADIAAGIRSLLADPALLGRFAAAQKSWASDNRWETVSRRLYDLMRGEFVEGVMASTQPAREGESGVTAPR